MAGWYFGNADGTGNATMFYGPSGAAVGGAGVIYVADTANNTIRKGIPANSVPSPMLGSPKLEASQLIFGISGLPGLTICIESSRDLSHWQISGTCILNNATNAFVDPNPTQPDRFYRGQVR